MIQAGCTFCRLKYKILYTLLIVLNVLFIPGTIIRLGIVVFTETIDYNDNNRTRCPDALFIFYY